MLNSRMLAHAAQRARCHTKAAQLKKLLFDLPFIEIKMCTHGIICSNKFMLLKPRS